MYCGLSVALKLQKKTECENNCTHSTLHSKGDFQALEQTLLSIMDEEVSVKRSMYSKKKRERGKKKKRM